VHATFGPGARDGRAAEGEPADVGAPAGEERNNP